MNLNDFIDRCTWWLERAIALCLAVMVVMVFGNVVLRYLFNDGIVVSEELSRWLFVWMTFLGAVVALKEHGHLGTDLLVSRLGPAGRRACMALSLLLMLAVTGMLFMGSLAQTRINWDVEAPVTGFSQALVYLSGMVFAVPAAALLLLELFRVLSGRLHDDELLLARESEDLPPPQAHHPGGAQERPK